MKSLKQIICTIYLAVLFIVYPIFQHDHYYSMGDVKYKFYLISTIIFLVLLVITIVTDPDTYKKSSVKSIRKNSNKHNNKTKNTKTTSVSNLSFKERLIQCKAKFIAWYGPKSIVEKFVWAYLLFAIISFIFGINHYYGFWGADGWYMGLLVQCLMIACFFVYAKVWEPDMLPFYFSMIGSSIVMILGIVMRFGIDPLGNYEGLEELYVRSFVSTIGQTSWYSSYICTIIPIGVVLFFVSDNSKRRSIGAVYTVLAFFALAIADSDSVLLGVAGMLLVLFWVAFSTPKYMINFWWVVFILFGSFVVMEKTKEGLAEYYNSYVELTSSRGIIIRLYTMLFVISILILLSLLILRKTQKLDKVFETKKVLITLRVCIYACVCVTVITVLVYIVLNTLGMFGVTDEMISNYGSVWFFNDAWGNNRGVSWRTCWYIFSDYSIWRKLIGIGPDSLAVATQSIDKYREMISNIHGSDNVLTCAHNEFYNHIIVYGILGGVTYLGIFISGIKTYIKSFVNRPEILMGAVCIASYMGHNSFCYQTVICTPFIFVIIGICESVLKKDREEN